MNQTAIYGGSFNPPTLSHKNVIKWVINSWVVSQIILTPDGVRKDKNQWISKTHRHLLIDAFFSELKKDSLPLDLDFHFLDSDTPTTTMEVEKYFFKKLWFYPWHIFGSDTISHMPSWDWNRERYIEDRLKKIIILRAGYPIVADLDMKNLQILDFPIEPISSTIARERIKFKKLVNDILSNDVIQVIDTLQLYQD